MNTTYSHDAAGNHLVKQAPVARAADTVGSVFSILPGRFYDSPVIVYLADAVGTQTEAVAVRGLSLSHAPIKSLLNGELRTGLLIGLLLGILIFPYVFLTSGDTPLALAVSLAVVTAGGFATTIGFLLPWLFSSMGKDPAFGSGPIATIIQNVLSLLIYFIIVDVLIM